MKIQQMSCTSALVAETRITCGSYAYHGSRRRPHLQHARQRRAHAPVRFCRRVIRSFCSVSSRLVVPSSDGAAAPRAARSARLGSAAARRRRSSSTKEPMPSRTSSETMAKKVETCGESRAQILPRLCPEAASRAARVSCAVRTPRQP